MKVNDVISIFSFFGCFLTKKWNFDQITPIHAQIGYTLNWYSALAFLRLSPSELLCSGCLPSDVFIFNWGVITPVCITARLEKKKKNTWEREEEDAPPRAAAAAASSAAACILLLEGGGAPRCLLALVAIEDPSQPPFCLFCNKMGCYSLLLRKKIHPETLRWGLWRFHVLTFGCWFIYICYSMLWTSKRMKEGLLC